MTGVILKDQVRVADDVWVKAASEGTGRAMR